MLAIIAALALAAPTLEAPRLPPIRRDPQITYLDRSRGQSIAVRGGRYGPPVDITFVCRPTCRPPSSPSEDRRFWSQRRVRSPGHGSRAAIADLGARRAAPRALHHHPSSWSRNLFSSPRTRLARGARPASWSTRSSSSRPTWGKRPDPRPLSQLRAYFGAGAYGLEAAARRYFRPSRRPPDPAPGGHARGVDEVAHRLQSHRVRGPPRPSARGWCSTPWSTPAPSPPPRGSRRSPMTPKVYKTAPTAGARVLRGLAFHGDVARLSGPYVATRSSRPPWICPAKPPPPTSPLRPSSATPAPTSNRPLWSRWIWLGLRAKAMIGGSDYASSAPSTARLRRRHVRPARPGNRSSISPPWSKRAAHPMTWPWTSQ